MLVVGTSAVFLRICAPPFEGDLTKLTPHMLNLICDEWVDAGFDKDEPKFLVENQKPTPMLRTGRPRNVTWPYVLAVKHQ